MVSPGVAARAEQTERMDRMATDATGLLTNSAIVAMLVL
jgi:hypothetical protein